MKNNISGSFIIAYDFKEGDIGVLIVGTKTKGQDVKIINAFRGAEARELYEKLKEPANKEEAKSNGTD